MFRGDVRYLSAVVRDSKIESSVDGSTIDRYAIFEICPKCAFNFEYCFRTITHYSFICYDKFSSVQ